MLIFQYRDLLISKRLDNRRNQSIFIFFRPSFKEIKCFFNFMQSIHYLLKDTSFVVSASVFAWKFNFSSSPEYNSLISNGDVWVLHLLPPDCFEFFICSSSSKSFLLKDSSKATKLYRSFILSQRLFPYIFIYKIWDCMGIEISSNSESELASER